MANPARFSTYSGAPSLKPSLAPTFGSTDTYHSTRTTTYLSPRNNNSSNSRDSTMYYSPDASASTSTLNSNDPRAADIKHWTGSLERMQDARLDAQRFVMNDSKTDEVSKLALSAKVERALARRMVGQDATFSVARKDAEKRGWEVEAR